MKTGTSHFSFRSESIKSVVGFHARYISFISSTGRRFSYMFVVGMFGPVDTYMYVITVYSEVFDE